MRKTHALIQVAATLLEDPKTRHWGYDTAKKAGVRSGVLYPMLTRFLEAGWVTDGWESTENISGRPPRRYYQLTNLGLARLGAILAEAETDARFAHVLASRPGRQVLNPPVGPPLRPTPGIAT